MSTAEQSTATEEGRPPNPEADTFPQSLMGCVAQREMRHDTGRTSATAPWRETRWRRVFAMTALALIALSIWYLQSGRGLPWQGNAGGAKSGLRVGGIRQDGQAAFVTFESQGIKLGAAGGEGPKIGEAAPNFTLLDLDGKPVKLSDFRGKTVVMNFWTTWCPPCRTEFPELVKLYQANADRGLVMLGVDIQESTDIVRDFAQQYAAQYPIVIDTKGDVTKQYRVIGLPTTWFIDSNGIIRALFLGPLTPDLIARKLGEAGFAEAKKP